MKSWRGGGIGWEFKSIDGMGGMCGKGANGNNGEV